MARMNTPLIFGFDSGCSAMPLHRTPIRFRRTGSRPVYAALENDGTAICSSHPYRLSVQGDTGKVPHARATVRRFLTGEACQAGPVLQIRSPQHAFQTEWRPAVVRLHIVWLDLCVEPHPQHNPAHSYWKLIMPYQLAVLVGFFISPHRKSMLCRYDFPGRLLIRL